ncbi:MAG: GGDEF domain-containing protein [Arcobacteraceae bacterium]|nr:GGDEF domain-containing protein [Arcobacteraceae bacterium]
MLDSISQISKQTLLNLTKKGKNFTPSEYEKEYCKVANELNLSQSECEYFKELLSKISKEEIIQSNVKEVESIRDIIEILLLRSPRKNIDKMSELMQSSLQPSISLSINDDLKSFCIKIGDSPSLIFEESIQQEMEKFIEKRFEVDKKIVAQKTADIARLISLMNKYLSDAIDSSKSGSSNVSDIKDEIQSIKISGSTKDELNQLQTKLVQAAITIENEMSSVSKNLETGKNEVIVLENKVKTLERELAEAKLTSTKDFLTGTLNRKTYEEEIKKFENEFIRKNQNYAIIFFDIDHFKSVNDNYGHECGDIILKTFSSLLLKLTRDLDIVGRYGGEEFVVALHYNDKAELDKYVSRIKSVITKNKFIYKNEKLKITFSAGVQIRSNNNSIEETIANADKLLYKAKQTGRNKIIFWDGKEI